ncbi:MAG: glycosyltransferase [Thermoleophilia bacterium]
MLARVLAGLRADPRAPEVVVVDNGSVHPESLRLMDAPGLVVERMPGAFNFSRLCNRGAHVATGEVLVFLNDDIEFPPGAGWVPSSTRCVPRMWWWPAPS